MTTADLTLTSTGGLDEETARAEVYGLLSPLFYAPASAELLAQIRAAVTQAPTAGGFLEEPWRTVVAASRSMDDAQIQAEFHALFGGVGKPEVYLFGSHYLSGFLNDKPVARLRTDLAALGLGRVQSMHETEDHIAYLCEVMRYLIAGDDVAVANLAKQKVFFGDHIQPWVYAMCDTVAAHPKANFYKAVTEFWRAFANVEQQGFDLLD